MKVNRLNTFRESFTQRMQGPFDRRALFMVGAGLTVALGGLVIMLLTGTFAGFGGTQGTAGQASPQVALQTPQTIRVVVAVVDIGTGTVMTGSQLRVLDYPIALAPPDALHDVVEAVGNTPTLPIFSGQILLRRQLESLPTALEGNTPRVAADPAGEIPVDKVLAAFPATDLLNSTGAVQAGDHVDLLLSMPALSPAPGATPEPVGKSSAGTTGRLVAQVTLQDITVFNIGYWQKASAADTAASNPQSVSGAPLAAAQAPAPAMGTGPSVLTFILSPQEALVLKYVKDSGGSMDMVIRSSSNTKKTTTDPVDSQYIIDHYGFNGPQK
jgi:pilus assembly protein CpaB